MPYLQIKCTAKVSLQAKLYFLSSSHYSIIEKYISNLQRSGEQNHDIHYLFMNILPLHKWEFLLVVLILSNKQEDWRHFKLRDFPRIVFSNRDKYEGYPYLHPLVICNRHIWWVGPGVRARSAGRLADCLVFRVVICCIQKGRENVPIGLAGCINLTHFRKVGNLRDSTNALERIMRPTNLQQAFVCLLPYQPKNRELKVNKWGFKIPSDTSLLNMGDWLSGQVCYPLRYLHLKSDWVVLIFLKSEDTAVL